MKKYRYNTRKFLNKRGYHSTAIIFAYVESSEGCKSCHSNDDHCWHGVEFVLSDCGRQISLDFDLMGKGNRANSLHKADMLAKAVSEFRDALHKEAAAQDAAEANRKAAKAAKKAKGSR